MKNRDCWRYFFYYYLDYISELIFFPCLFISVILEISFLVYGKLISFYVWRLNYINEWQKSLFLYLGSSLVYSAPYLDSKNNATFALTFTNTSSNAYCDETFFEFSYWSFSSVYISLGLLILVKLVSDSCNTFENSVKIYSTLFSSFSLFVSYLVSFGSFD